MGDGVRLKKPPQERGDDSWPPKGVQEFFVLRVHEPRFRPESNRGTKLMALWQPTGLQSRAFQGGSMAHDRFEGDRMLMRIHIGESDKWHHKLLYEAIVEMFRQEGFAGATVLRGVASYGASTKYHTNKILRLAQELPIIIEVVEYEERIQRILPKLDEMIGGGLITLEKVHVILYRPHKDATTAGAKPS
jgi:uncharacterized protein